MAYALPSLAVTGQVIAATWGNQNRDNWAESAVAKVAAAGDLVVGTGANAVARLPKGSALQGLRVNAAGTGLEYATPATTATPTGPAGGALAGTYPNPTLAAGAIPIANTSSESVLGSDVPMTAGVSWTDTGMSLSLAAGEWLLLAHVSFTETSGAGSVDARIYDATGAATLAVGSQFLNVGEYRNLTLATRVVLAATSTVKVQYWGPGSSAMVIKASANSGLAGATKLVAVRVA